MLAELLTAFTLGLFGSSHCLGMCGGISAAIGSQQQDKKTIALGLYNLGRITSYTVAGLLAGLLGSLILSQAYTGLLLLKLFSGLLIILMGCYLARWSLLLVNIEKCFSPIWRLIQPAATKTLSNPKLSGKFITGLIWGWLPCGLVYSSLSWAITTGHAINASLIMLCFGLGTLPMMFATGFFAAEMKKLLNNQKLRSILALLIITFGLQTIAVATLQLLA